MASGDTLLVLVPESAALVGADAATLDTVGATKSVVIDFDASSDEEAVWKFVMPENYGGATGITLELHYSMSTATSGNIAIEAAWERMPDGHDVTTDSFAAVNTTGADAVPATADEIEIATITFTDGADMDSVVAGDLCRLKVNRDVGIASNASGDLELHAIHVKET